jgi:phosphoribosylformylglycinamidine synthase subunit PurQ / glutaminase
VTRPVALVITGPGTNRDTDAVLALDLAGAEPTVVLAGELATRPELLDTARIVVVAGGFSYGDALGAGRMLALDLVTGDGGQLGDRLRSFVADGRPVLGICNGFQVLTRAGLLPGALGHNAGGTFDCRWVELAPDRASRCIWTDRLEDEVHCPIAHGEGRYVHPDPVALATAGQVALRYAGTNPNGSVADIAGVCDDTGVVLGLMPHPENHVIPRQHPRHRQDPGTVRYLGLHLFEAAVRHVK